MFSVLSSSNSYPNSLASLSQHRLEHEPMSRPRRLVAMEEEEERDELETRTSFNEKRIILNVGGVRYEAMWKTLEKIPNSRLGKIRFAASIEQIEALCDDYSFKDNELFFDRHSNSFNSVINFYRTGKLHLIEDICVMSFHEDLCYWGIDEAYFESCCHLR